MTTIRNPSYSLHTPTGWVNVNDHAGITGGDPEPDWAEEFDSLDMTTSSHTGVWRPNDFWQNIDRGYEDFAGTSWNANPNETAVDIDPFSISSSVLTITCQSTPSESSAAIAASMAAQGQSGGVPAWTGGILMTNRDLRSFLYGYFEVKARFADVGQGMFPAIWLYSALEGSDPDNKGSAEIDIFEIFGHASGSPVNITLHKRNNSGSGTTVDVDSYAVDATEWHTYALDWQPTYMRFYLDGVLKAEVTGADAEWFSVPMSLRLNYSMNAGWFPSGQQSDGTTPDPLTMEIDYVRYWETMP